MESTFALYDQDSYQDCFSAKVLSCVPDNENEKYHVILTIGIYAIDSNHNDLRKSIHETAMEHQGVLGTHAIYIDDEAKTMTIDVMTDFQVDRKALCEDLMGHIAEYLPGYKADINFDNNFSD